MWALNTSKSKNQNLSSPDSRIGTAMAKFQKGQSGNPSGRPKSDKANLKPLLEKHGKLVLQKVVDQALDGDLTACKLILERLYPPIRPQTQTISIAAKETLTEQGQTIINQTLAGNIAPDTAGGLITMLCNQGKLVELYELTGRIESLENEK